MFIVRVSNTFTLRYPKTVLFEGWLPLLAHLLFVATGPMPRTLINLLDHHQNSKKTRHWLETIRWFMVCVVPCRYHLSPLSPGQRNQHHCDS